MGGGIGAGMMGIPGGVDRPVASALRKFEHLGQSVSSIRARGCSAELPFLDFAAPRLKRATCANPTVEWISRQITEAFPWDSAPCYLSRDRDTACGLVFAQRLL
jgi:hypothetical protein